MAGISNPMIPSIARHHYNVHNQPVHATGLQATEHPLLAVHNMYEAAPMLNELADLTGEEYIKEFTRRIVHDEPFMPRGVKWMPEGFNLQGVTAECIIPLVSVKILSIPSANMGHNFNACRILTCPLMPKRLPQKLCTFKYVLEKAEIPIPEPGGVRHLTGENMRSRIEMLIGLSSTSLTTRLPMVEFFQRLDPDQKKQQIAIAIEQANTGWHMHIALMHYQYAAAQPQMSELITAKNGAYYAGRDRVAALVDTVNIDNALEGALNRSAAFFPLIVSAMVNMIKCHGNDYVVIVPECLGLKALNEYTHVPLPSRQYFYDTDGLDTNDQRLNVDWAHSLVRHNNKLSLVKRSTSAALDVDPTTHAILEQRGNHSVSLPTLSIGPDTKVPIIVLDSTAFGTDRPSMESPFVTRGVKRYFYTCGALPPSYRTLMNQSFYGGDSVISMQQVAARSSRVTCIVNYDQQATTAEIALCDLHAFGNTAASFSHQAASVKARDNLPPLRETTVGDHYIRLKRLFLYVKPGERLDDKLCLYEFNPRCAIFPVTTPGIDNQFISTAQTAPRICLYNASYLQGADADMVSTLSGLVSFLGHPADLDKYLHMAAQGFGNVSPASVFFLVFCRTLLDLGINKRILHDSFASFKLPTGVNAPALTAQQSLESTAWRRILQLFQHMCDTGGHCLSIADPYASYVCTMLIDFYFENRTGFEVCEKVSLFFHKDAACVLMNIGQVVKNGRDEFGTMVENIGVELVPSRHSYFRSDIRSGDLIMPKQQRRQCARFNELFAPGVCNTECVIRIGPILPDDAAHSVTGRTTETFYPDNLHVCHFDPVSGNFTSGAPTDETHGIAHMLYCNAFYCRSNGTFLEAANSYMLGEQLTTTLLPGPMQTHSFKETADAAHKLQVYDVTPVRFTRDTSVMWRAFRVLKDMQRRNPVGLANALPTTTYAGMLQPMGCLRRELLHRELHKFPLYNFYMQMHYSTVMSFDAVTQLYDLNYHSGLSYMCVRTMSYDGYSIAAMPIGASLFCTGNRTITAANTDPYSTSLNSTIEMAIIPGHAGSHGVVAPNVFLRNITGLNSIFVSPTELNTDEGTRMGVERRGKQLQNMTLVLDWYGSLLPPTTSGAQPSCEPVVPLMGRYLSLYTPGTTQPRPDYSNRYCESPTMLPFSDSHDRLRTMTAEAGDSDGASGAFPFASFLRATPLEMLGKSIDSEGQNPEYSSKAEAVLNAMLTRSSSTRPIRTPFTTHLSLAFADSYVIGAGGGLYLQSTPAANNGTRLDTDLNPRVIGEGLSPTNLYSPETTGHFMSSFGKVLNLPMQAGAINTYGETVGDRTAMSMCRT
ncbi:ORF54 [Ranid herpesvirus 1]|uniref:ORF54 n=1 Tax=Ranid herpesvirus 1 TaxID=85655 RepID=Q14VQ4_9VIRU|nr:ORF54 [Ranid herpesvirus 1]ABG25709.1 ORF54 [Ranid herpesvirus 1]